MLVESLLRSNHSLLTCRRHSSRLSRRLPMRSCGALHAIGLHILQVATNFLYLNQPLHLRCLHYKFWEVGLQGTCGSIILKHTLATSGSALGSFTKSAWPSLHVEQAETWLKTKIRSLFHLIHKVAKISDPACVPVSFTPAQVSTLHSNRS